MGVGKEIDVYEAEKKQVIGGQWPDNLDKRQAPTIALLLCISSY